MAMLKPTRVSTAAVALLLGASLFGSCNEFLEREPLDQISAESFYKTESDLKSAIYAAYTPVMDQWFMGQGWQLLEIPSDNTTAGGTDPGFTPIDDFTTTADNGAVAEVWANRYKLIALANVVLDRAPKAGLAEAVYKPYVAEASFLRALAYLDLVRLWGGVPLVLTPANYGDNLLVPRNSVSEVYDQIDADLTVAAAGLPLRHIGSEVGRATKGAALALHAKAELTRRNFVRARELARQVVALNVYGVLPDYGALWVLETSDNNAETIFQAQHAGCGPFGTGNVMQAFFAPYAEGITRNSDGWGSQSPTGPAISNPGTTVFDAFEEGDLRKRWTLLLPGQFYPEINAGEGGYTYPARGAGRAGLNIKKYVVGGGSNICFMSTPQNVNIIRYPDVLLTIAEAAVELDGGVSVNAEAVAAVNVIRKRAGLPTVTSLTREGVFAERRAEFAFECQRWFDILRTPDPLTTLRLHGKVLNEERLLFPIPSAERKINSNLTQNPGYE